MLERYPSNIPIYEDLLSSSSLLLSSAYLLLIFSFLLTESLGDGRDGRERVEDRREGSRLQRVTKTA